MEKPNIDTSKPAIERGNMPLVGKLKFYFKNPIVDGYFSYVLAFGARGGADVGEAFFAASRIRQYDTESWVREFTSLAKRVAEQAEQAQAVGHYITARETFLRASYLNRAALMSLSPNKEPDRYLEICERVRSHFNMAAALFDTPIEPVSIPFRNHILRGYFIKTDTSSEPRPTLINAGGGESFAEDMCLLFGIGDASRGYNHLTVDMPGQGSTFIEGMKMTPQAEEPLGAIVDYALSRNDVDPDRLAMFGPSFGGYAVPRAAVHDKRIKAIVVNSLILNLYDYLVQAKELLILARLERMPGFKLFTRLTGSWLAGLYNIMDIWKYKWGVSTMAEWLEACKEYVVDPSEITCPTLLLIGEDEYAYPNSQHFQHEALAKIQNPIKNLAIGRTDMGAGGKNMLPNLTAIRHTTFDWLDEVFAAKRDLA
ncbi:S9 family peptidase [Chroococcidiopsis sp. TS-821]|uniref:alpha/beta hydrolase family protein n=1 Tax=Chroococcidiopsis sp. TS-821 TaxID=1378066 RepID=UPI000CEED4C9|nr:alpha/beta hydrolase family protein [Chroococcidiopsis sp. TS-821]PPS44103.1 ABC transporter ATP-binding protein [Chroococcidiopsis sp. TS-821]